MLIKRFQMSRAVLEAVPENKKLINDFIEQNNKAYYVYKQHASIDRTLAKENFKEKKMTVKELYKQKVMYESEDLMKQTQYIKKRTDEVNALRGLDWVRFKHEKQHLEEMKQKMQMGLIFKTVDHLVEALKPNLLPEYTLDGLGKKKNSLNSNT